MKRELKGYEKNLLNNGNTYTMSSLLIEFYPEEMENEGYTFRKHVNEYRSYIEWNAEEKTYTFFGKTKKAYFDTNACCIGTKEW